VAAAVCVAVLVACLATKIWPLLALAALVGVLFCALAPRLHKRFVVRVSASVVEFTGELAESVVPKGR
jgi:hypothetical protein